MKCDEFLGDAKGPVLTCFACLPAAVFRIRSTTDDWRRRWWLQFRRAGRGGVVGGLLESHQPPPHHRSHLITEARMEGLITCRLQSPAASCRNYSIPPITPNKLISYYSSTVRWTFARVRCTASPPRSLRVECKRGGPRDEALSEVRREPGRVGSLFPPLPRREGLTTRKGLVVNSRVGGDRSGLRETPEGDYASQCKNKPVPLYFMSWLRIVVACTRKLKINLI